MIRKMSLKQNLISAITAHPKLVTVTIGFAIAAVVAVGLAVATSSEHMAYAFFDNNNVSFQTQINTGNSAAGQM